MLKKSLCLVLIGIILTGSVTFTVAAINQETNVDMEAAVNDSAYDNNNELLTDSVINTETEGRQSAFELTEEEKILAGDIDVSMRRVASFAVSPGEYYINNLYSGYFLMITNTGNVTTSLYQSGLMSYMTWTVREIDTNIYALSAYDGDVTHLLGVSSGVLVTMFDTTTVPQNYQWESEAAVGGGILIRNVSSGLVLSLDGETLCVHSQPESDHEDYTNIVWGMIRTTKFYLMQDIELFDDWLPTASEKFFDYRTTPTYASWVMPRNFHWWMPTNDNFTVNQQGIITSGAIGGTVTLTLTYKLTGQTWNFRITSGAVREGEYLIRNVRTSRYVDIKGPSIDNDVLLHQWQYHTGEWEKWRLTINEQGDYSIQSVYSGKYIHVAGALTTAGANIVQYEGSVNANARWQIKMVSSGNYRISPFSNLSMALGVPMGQDGDGVNLQQIPYGADSDYSDEWIFENIGPAPGIKNGGIYHIVAKHSNKALDVTGAGTTDGTVINQYPMTAGYQWQRWKFECWGNGEYKIHDMNSGKLLSIASSSHTEGTISHIWTSDNTAGQLFKIRANDDGTYSFLSTCSEYIRALTVNGGSTANGANLIQSTDLELDYQKFYLRESIADISFLYDPLNELYDYACEFKAGYSTSRSENELVMHYVRHNVSSYVTGNWSIVAGDIRQEFIDYVDARNGLLTVMFSGTPIYSAGAVLYDHDGNQIDFYHLCATINGHLYDSSIMDSPKTLIGEMFIDELCGWAGDLQTLTIDILEATNYSDDYDVIYNKTKEMIGDPCFSFSIPDLLADIDAVHLASDASPWDALDNRLYSYYFPSRGNRFTRFINGRDKDTLYKNIRIYTQKTIPHMYILEHLNMEDVVNGIIDLDEVSIWPLLRNVPTITENQADAIAQAFTDFLWERMELES